MTPMFSLSLELLKFTEELFRAWREVLSVQTEGKKAASRRRFFHQRSLIMETWTGMGPTEAATAK